MNPTPLPSPQQIREMMEMLLGRDVDVETGADMPSARAPGGVAVGLFTIDPGGRTAALWVSDLPASAAIGAAIGLLPPAQAAAAVEDGMNQLVSDNLREAINVSGSMLNEEGAPHVILKDVYLPGDALPSDVAGLVSAYVPRHDLKVSVVGYGAGVLSFIVP
jgi:hypothetical protein